MTRHHLIPRTRHSNKRNKRDFERAAKLFPASPIIHIEHANGLILLFGKARIDDATRLYEKAAALKPADAMERLDVEHAKSELE